MTVDPEMAGDFENLRNAFLLVYAGQRAAAFNMEKARNLLCEFEEKYRDRLHNRTARDVDTSTAGKAVP